MSLKDLLKLPEAGSIQDLNSPLTAKLHSQIIQNKRFLRHLYLDFYNEFKKSIQDLPKGALVEIGSGSGFIKEVIPEVITTDVFSGLNIDKVFLATSMPFESNTVAAFFMFDVLHHINNPLTFFNEANRCLLNHGKIIMIEPYNSLWGRFVYKNFHHEPFDISAGWEILTSGRLTGANGALPWIIFFRDREKFQKHFPELKIRRLTPHTPFRYLISGGLSYKQLLPSFTYGLVKGLETLLSPLNKFLGMFVTVELEKCKE